MTQPWHTVRIFISSTFRDMHAERDYLVRFVFPELRERCAKRRLHLVDVDLRWGVTEEEAEQGQVLAICLDEIERCRPFFIGLLGERYGWAPPAYAVPDEARYDWLRGFEPGHSATALEITHGVLRSPAMRARAFFYFRDPTFISQMPPEHRAVFQAESDVAATKLTRLKEDIRQHGPVYENYPCAYGGLDADDKVVLTSLEACGQRVLADLWGAIQQEYPETATPPDELAVEQAYHESFIENRSRRFIGRRDLLAQLVAYADGGDAVPLVVTGSPGCGKSALLANFARVYAAAQPEVFVLPHFIGVSPGSTDIRRTLLRLCRELARRYGIPDEIPEDYDQLRRAFPQFLEQAASRGQLLLLLDALNQLDETRRAHTLDWLPLPLPPGLHLIASALAGDCLEALHSRRPAPPEMVVGPLGSEDRREIVRLTLWDYRKRLDDNQMGRLLDQPESANPLYLVVACEELRVFGEFERVTARIAGLPADVPALFEQVLERLEGDHGRALVQKALSLLVGARHGLLEPELLELLRREGEEQLPRAIWARLYRGLQFYLRPPGEAGALKGRFLGR